MRKNRGAIIFIFLLLAGFIASLVWGQDSEIPRIIALMKESISKIGDFLSEMS
jgi:hypothetical protein